LAIAADLAGGVSGRPPRCAILPGMTRRLPPLNALKAFEAAARLRHIGRAADELHVTRGAVSQQIRALEQWLGVALFVRNAQGLEPTAAGRALFPVIEESLDAIAAKVRGLSEPGLEGSLTVAMAPAFGAKWFLYHLDGFLQRFPSISIKTGPLPPMSTTPPDCALFIEYGRGHWPGREVVPLHAADFAPLMSPRLVNALPERIAKIEDLLECRLIHDDDGGLWNRWLARAGCRLPVKQGGVFVGDFVNAIDAAVAGLGVLLADDVTTAANLADGSLVRVLDIKLPGDGSYSLVYEPACVADPVARAFIGWLTDAFGVPRPPLRKARRRREAA
jgi:LysR family glycine cleavage system transcriptional activator